MANERANGPRPGDPRTPKGRGTGANPPGRFETIALEADPEWLDQRDEEEGAVATLFLSDTSRSVIATNDSPDIPFDASLNPYRGCEHGCSYCYARPFHEYLGFSAGLDFESRILVKEDAPELLRRQLTRPSWRPQVLALSGVTDPYQPIERRLRLTRRCLEVLAEFRNPVGIVTKNHLVTRDIDLLAELASHDAAAVSLSITTLDGKLAAKLEPRASHPDRRLAAIAELAAAGIPTGVMLAPIIPGLTDHEIPALVAAAAEAGAQRAAMLPLRLPGAVEQIFSAWLEEHVPERKERVLARLRELRGGRLNDPRFGSRMRGEGIYAEQLRQLFHTACRRARLGTRGIDLSTDAFRRPDEQLGLFG